MKKEFKWTSFYEKFAIKLLDYKNDRDELIRLVKEVYQELELSLPTFEKDGSIIDIDPFTVFGTFNRQMTDENRSALIKKYGEKFEVEAEIPTTFEGIPVLFNHNALYYGLIDDRDKGDIDLLWDLFEAAVDYTKNKSLGNAEKFCKYFDESLNINHVALAKITMGLYMMFPRHFISLDAKNKRYIYESSDFPQEIVEQLPNSTDIKGHDYLKIIDVLEEYFSNDDSICKNFMELSDKAYLYIFPEEKVVSYVKEEKTNYGFCGKNVIVYGVPGSGKSNYINRIIKDVPDERIERVIFYPEYSYYDFIGQKVPSKNGNLVFEKGNFSRILEKALKNPKYQYYLIIEELNRGNCEAIFGDIFQLLDRNSDGESEYRIHNTNLCEELNLSSIYIPSNLTIYATINNADQNVFNFDTAFSRRWDYKLITCNPNKDNKDNTENKIFENGYISGTNIKWDDFRRKLNTYIISHKNEIYHAEEKLLGLYYVDKSCLSLEKNNDLLKAREDFASKIFRYLYLSVFHNNEELIFKNAYDKVLEDYINDFVENKDLNAILLLDLDDSE